MYTRFKKKHEACNWKDKQIRERTNRKYKKKRIKPKKKKFNYKPFL